jgi:23S rRNA (uracil1939-C5)-methyltransferase
VAETLVIDHVGQRGDGVCIADGKTLFVPYALAGETVEAAALPSHPDRMQLLRVERASTERIDPFCPHFGRCGGCAIQHWQPDAYRAWKRQLVVDTLARAGIDCRVDALIDAHGAGRRRLVVHARRDADGTVPVASQRRTATQSYQSMPARSSIRRSMTHSMPRARWPRC